MRVTFCDIHKAFDRVWHAGLIHKLEGYGIKHGLLRWFKNYLYDRYQRVLLNGQYSNWGKINAGVPQGSVLGPLLFLLYINDITLVTKHCNIRLFADDTCLYINVDDPEASAQMINDDLQAIADWADRWLVSFSPQKTESMLISNKKIKINHPPLYFNGVQIKEVTEHKHVGVTLCNNLSWSSHLNETELKSNKRLDILKYVQFKLDRKSLETLYKMYVRSVIEYADVVWAGANKNELTRLDNIQKRAARIVTGATAKVGTDKLYEEVGWERLECRRKKHMLILMYKIINNLAPRYLNNLLPMRVNERAHYPLRSGQNYSTVLARLYNYSHSFIPEGTRMWNSLDLITREIKEFSIFKSEINKKFTESKSNSLYYRGERLQNIHHARLRMGCSKLNSHLYNNLHVIDNPQCACGYVSEDVIHYFLHCPLFAAQRIVLLNSVGDVAPINVATFLYGNNDAFVHNSLIFDSVHKYITNTGRLF